MWKKVRVRHIDVARVAALRVLAHDFVRAAEDIITTQTFLACAAAQSRIHQDLVADLPRACCAWAERFYFARNVGSQTMRELISKMRQASAGPEINVIERHCSNPHTH